MKIVQRTIIGLMFMTATLVGATQAAATPATAHQASPAFDYVHITAGAPCIVTGYTLEAEKRMAQRKINSDQIETLVHNTCSRARWQPSKGTWLYTDGYVTAALNSNGYVVTVWKKGS